MKSDNKHKRSGTKESVKADSLLAADSKLSVTRVLLLTCLLSFLAYANSLGGEFVFDDTEQIVENQNIRSWENLGKAFTTHVWAFRERPGTLNLAPPLPYYRPLFTAMLTLEYHMFGLWPQGWHLVSVLLHALCAVGVFYVILLMSGGRLVAFIASLIFVVHPVHAESVSWISGMTDPLFGVFFLASFYFYLQTRQSSEGASRRALVLSLMMFVLATFAKETALSLVLVVFGYELIASAGPGMRSVLDAAKRAAPYAAVALIYLVPRYLVLGELMWKNPQAPDRPLAYTLLTLPFVVCSYLAHLLWPVGLSVNYNTHFVTTATSPSFFLPAAALGLSAATLFYYRKSVGRGVWHALLLLFVPLLPVLNLGKVSREEYLIFDHYLYLSVAGAGYLVAIGIRRLGAFEPSVKQTSVAGSRRPAFAIAVFAMIVLGLTVATARENKPWADSYSLWSNVARVRPAYWAAYYNVGLALLDAKRFDEARAALERATALKPDEPNVLDALGRAYDGMGDSSNAVTSFKRAIQIDDGMFESFNNLGTVYLNSGDNARAEEQFSAALRLMPGAIAPRFNLGICYKRQGRYLDAAREFERIVESSEADAGVYYELGSAYEHIGRRTEAAEKYRRGLAMAEPKSLQAELNEGLARLQRESSGAQP
ncbi:MAG: tetratricopeptide repeat protein [Acidobacteriota bacterium]